MREARINARLQHPHVVAVFDVVEHEGQPCLVMELVPSRTLAEVLREQGTLAPPEAARVGSQVASALAAAHGLGIVHRDVKPSNILIGEDGRARISDFGISRATGDTTLTMTGMINGTPAYLAPEVARGNESTRPSDVFSLGSTLYAALEGSSTVRHRRQRHRAAVQGGRVRHPHAAGGRRPRPAAEPHAGSGSRHPSGDGRGGDDLVPAER